MKPCLIITANATSFADEIARTPQPGIPVRTCLSPDEARRRYDGEEILLGNPAMIAEILADLPGVRWVQSTWAGVTPLINHPRRNYVLTGVKDIFGPQMSEYVMGYLLAHELRIQERLEAQRQQAWFTDHSGTLAGKNIGMMGTGSIGRHIAATARTFGLSTIGLNRSGQSAEGFDVVYPVSRIEEFLAGCNYLVAALPQTPSTDRLLDAAALALLPDGALFINVGRSNVVDDAALITALHSGKLAGAVLDVFDEEPVPPGSRLWTTPNLSITAHVAAVSHPSLIVPIFIDNYRRFTADETLRYVVDFSAGY